MEVIVAKTAGFCFGVKRAVDKVYDCIGDKKVYTYGPIIHNEEVVAELERKGVSVLEETGPFPTVSDSTVIIRSHGVAESVYNELEKSGFEIVDATCPFVLKIHKIVEEESKSGNTVIIIGNENHPEVEGIKGWSHGNTFVIGSSEEALEFNIDTKKVTIVSQTTFNYKKFQEIVEILQERGYDIKCLNTICNATQERQTEALSIAKVVDAMIVIGGKSSSNTQKLYDICSRECKMTFYIQTAEDMDFTRLNGLERVGITAGASTPKNIIQEVQTRCQNSVLNRC